MVKEWQTINLSKNSKIKARIGWQGLTTAEYLDEGYAYLVTGTDIKSGRVDWGNCHFVTYERYAQDVNIQIANGDLLLSKDGTIGKVALVSNLRRPATLNSGVFVIRPTTAAYITEYMFYVLESFIFKDFLGQLSAGSTINHLYQKDIIKFECALPPISEQKNIATVLSTMDRLISELTRLIAKKKVVRQGAMQLLVSGKKRLSGFSGDWKVTSLDKLCKIITKQTGFDYSAEIKPSLVTAPQIGAIPFIQNKDFEGFDINYNTDFFIPCDVAERYPKILLDEVCLLISISGRIGNVAVFDNKQKAFAGGAVGIAKLFDPAIANWCMLYLSGREGQEQIFSNEKVGAQHNLTVADVRKLEIKLPEKTEREAIISILSDMDNEIRILEEKLQKHIQMKQGMMEELLTGKVRLV